MPFLIPLHHSEESTASLIQHKSPLISVMNLQANFLLPTISSCQMMRSAAVKYSVTPGKKLLCFESHVALFRRESQGTLQTLGARSRERCEWVILLEWNTLPFPTQICVYMCAFIFLDTLVLVIYPFVLQIITCCGFNWMQIYSSLPVLNSLQLNSCCVLGVINLHKIWDGLA